jgi:hypothetical protein
MSSRVAWRLETFGFAHVYRYAPGQVDWLSRGLSGEDKRAHELQIGAIARTDVSTARSGQHVGDVQTGADLCVVINDECIVLGDLRGDVLAVDPQTPIERVMRPGPVTYRPDVTASATPTVACRAG